LLSLNEGSNSVGRTTDTTHTNHVNDDETTTDDGSISVGRTIGTTHTKND
jgi:hypothetical protein